MNYKTYKGVTGKTVKAIQITENKFKLDIGNGISLIGNIGDWLVEESPTEKYILKDSIFRTNFTIQKKQLLFD